MFVQVEQRQIFAKINTTTTLILHSDGSSLRLGPGLAHARLFLDCPGSTFLEGPRQFTEVRPSQARSVLDFFLKRG